MCLTLKAFHCVQKASRGLGRRRSTAARADEGKRLRQLWRGCWFLACQICDLLMHDCVQCAIAAIVRGRCRRLHRMIRRRGARDLGRARALRTRLACSGFGHRILPSVHAFTCVVRRAVVTAAAAAVEEDGAALLRRQEADLYASILARAGVLVEPTTPRSRSRSARDVLQEPSPRESRERDGGVRERGRADRPRSRERSHDRDRSSRSRDRSSSRGHRSRERDLADHRSARGAGQREPALRREAAGDRRSAQFEEHRGRTSVRAHAPAAVEHSRRSSGGELGHLRRSSSAVGRPRAARDASMYVARIVEPYFG